jgi:hypothetical protein
LCVGPPSFACLCRSLAASAGLHSCSWCIASLAGIGAWGHKGALLVQATAVVGLLDCSCPDGMVVLVLLVVIMVTSDCC